MLINQLLQTRFTRESINVFPELRNGIYRFITLKTQPAYLVIDKTSYHLELHDPIITEEHVLYQMGVASTVKSMRTTESQ